jgi:hypothetical protein
VGIKGDAKSYLCSFLAQSALAAVTTLTTHTYILERRREQGNVTIFLYPIFTFV